jgi:hypothetical protein
MNRIFRHVAWQSFLWSALAAAGGSFMQPGLIPAYVLAFAAVACLAGILALLNAADIRAKNRKLDS